VIAKIYITNIYILAKIFLIYLIKKIEQFIMLKNLYKTNINI